MPAQVQGKRRRRRDGNVSAGSPGSAETGGLSLEISEPAVVDADAVRLNAARSAHSPGRSQGSLTAQDDPRKVMPSA